MVELRAGIDRVGDLLNTGFAGAAERVESLLGRVAGLERDVERFRSQERVEPGEMAAGATTIGDATLVVGEAHDMDGASLRQLALGIRERIGARSAGWWSAPVTVAKERWSGF